ncbi:MAG: hypothetical protein RMJ98_06055 [Myxococcales bacterium]|nr:hypothetical protein [Polyangiaceae bacterium]MDW8248852.1 hypothetical protein [Myxococcales bacterium]
MTRIFLGVGVLLGAGACEASYSSFAIGSVPAAPGSAISPVIAVPTGRTAQVDRSAPAASAIPVVEDTREGQVVTNNPLAALALEFALLQQQQQHLPGRKPVGEPMGGVLRQGQAIREEVRLIPGRCYSMLGYSPSVSVFVLELAPKVGNPHLARSTDGVAVLDGTPCYQVAMEQEVTVGVMVQVGAGPVVARLYER